jgi:hypothetical protein
MSRSDYHQIYGFLLSLEQEYNSSDFKTDMFASASRVIPDALILTDLRFAMKLFIDLARVAKQNGIDHPEKLGMPYLDFS